MAVFLVESVRKTNEQLIISSRLFCTVIRVSPRTHLQSSVARSIQKLGKRSFLRQTKATSNEMPSSTENDPTASSVVVLVGILTFALWWWYSGRNSSGKGKLRTEAYSKIDIEDIAKKCKESGNNWKDPSFGHDMDSIGVTLELRDGERGKPLDLGSDSDITWQPPAQFCKTSRPLGIRGDDGVATWLYSDTDGDTIVTACEAMNLTDVAQGSVGNCYFLSALAAVVQRHPDICDDLIDERYEEQGIYGVSFWIHNQWRMVWVDSYFPCYRSASKRGKKYRLLFAGSVDQKEIWPLVIEKAFAKLNGSYEAISGGHICDALKLLTGSNQTHRYQPTASNWGKVCQDVRQEETLVGASSQHVKFDPAEAARQEKDLNGIVTGHAYTVTSVYEDGDLKLVELRNPWGRGEWKGDWGQGSNMWGRSDEGREADKEVGSRRSEPGRFWMSFEDLCKCFTSIDTCTIELSEEDKARREELAKKAAEIVAKNDRPSKKNSNGGGVEYTQESADAMMELLIAEEAREKRKQKLGARGNKHKQKKKH